MNYTENEKQIINEAFLVTRKEFDHDQDIENDIEVLRALNLYKDRYYMPQSYKDDAIEIFKKLGYASNGKQTIQEFDRKVKSEQVKTELQLNEVRKKRFNRLENLEKQLQEAKQKITLIPQKIKEGMTLDMDILVNQMKDEIEEMYRVKINKIDRIIQETNEAMDEKIKSVHVSIMQDLTKSKNIRINRLRLDIVENAKDFENLVAEILIESEKTPLEVKLEEKTRSHEVVEEKEEQEDLYEYTVRELKEMIQAKGLECPARAVKAELVEILEG